MCNVGHMDKLIRAIIGLTLLVVAVLFENWWLGGAGVIVIATALLGFCGIYALFGINTGCKTKAKDSEA